MARVRRLFARKTHGVYIYPYHHSEACENVLGARRSFSRANFFFLHASLQPRLGIRPTQTYFHFIFYRKSSCVEDFLLRDTSRFCYIVSFIGMEQRLILLRRMRERVLCLLVISRAWETRALNIMGLIKEKCFVVC